jgi:hypothetical protein
MVNPEKSRMLLFLFSWNSGSFFNYSKVLAVSWLIKLREEGGILVAFHG